MKDGGGSLVDQEDQVGRADDPATPTRLTGGAAGGDTVSCGTSGGDTSSTVSPVTSPSRVRLLRPSGKSGGASRALRPASWHTTRLLVHQSPDSALGGTKRPTLYGSYGLPDQPSPGQRHPAAPYGRAQATLAACVGLGYAAVDPFRTLQTSIFGTDGFVALSVLYGCAALSTVSLSAVAGLKSAAKWTMAAAQFGFLLWVAANLSVGTELWWTPIAAAAICGTAAMGPLWSCHERYWAAAARHQVTSSGQPRDKVANSFLRTSHTLWYLGLSLGDAVAATILNLVGRPWEGSHHLHRRPFCPTENHQVSHNTTLEVPVDHLCACGTYLCSADSHTTTTTWTLQHSPGAVHTQVAPHTWQLLVGTTCGISLLAFVCTAAFLPDLNLNTRTRIRTTTKDDVCDTLTCFTRPTFILVLPLVAFVGLQRVFFIADFTKFYVTCSLGLRHVPYVVMCSNLVTSLSHYLVNQVSKHINGLAVTAAGLVFHVGVLLVLWLWKPDHEDIPVLYVVAAGWGLCDTIWTSQSNAMLWSQFPDQWEAVQSACRLVQWAVMSVSFLGWSLCPKLKIYIMAAALLTTLPPFVLLDLKIQHRRKQRQHHQQQVRQQQVPQRQQQRQQQWAQWHHHHNRIDQKKAVIV